jgi:UMF1 family MFS transporter
MGIRSIFPTVDIRGKLTTLGLDRRETVSWVLFDWGDNAFATVVTGALLPVYYEEFIGTSADYAAAIAASFVIVALISPVLGTIADHVERSREFLAVFTAIGVVFTAGLFFTREGGIVLTSMLLILANIGFRGARLFYNSLLPGITEGDTIDRVSTAGYAMGYIGGGTLLALSAIVLGSPSTFGLSEAGSYRVALFAAAVWWAVFAIPLFLYVPEPEKEGGEAVVDSPVRVSFRRLYDTYQNIQNYRVAFIFLIAFWFYTNGISAIITLSAAYAADIGIGAGAIIGAFIMVQFVGVPCAFGFGQLADRFSTKRAIYLGLSVYTLVAIGAFGVNTAWHFFALAFAVALVQGGTQGLSRSLFGSLIPEHKSSEFFSFFTIVGGSAGILAPALFSAIGRLTGSSRLAIASLSLFFIVGALLLRFVDVEEGRRAAEESTPGTQAESFSSTAD